MKVLIIGSGGREHALAWKAAQSQQVAEVLVAPGNGGTAATPKCRNIDIAADNTDRLLEFAQSENVGLTIVGPEGPLVNGIVDQFQSAGLACFGPTADAAQLEGSKAYAKEFMQRHEIPTAAFAEFNALQSALDYLAAQTFPQVVKASGLAAGKGVIIAEDLAAAEAAVHDILTDKQFGDAGESIVIEDFLDGEEASFIVIADGTDYIEFATSQDHKRAFEGDQGPNTGGMGAYSPAPVVNEDIRQRIIDQIIQPTLDGLKKDGIHYTGFLYAGVMIDRHGQPRVLEYNCRLGDPETQPLLMRLQSDLVALTSAALEHRLDTAQALWDTNPALAVVMAAEGYPGGYQKGMAITGNLTESHDCTVFHAGTEIENGQLQSNGGRVLTVTAKGNDLQAARDSAYRRVSDIAFEHAFFRRDIGHRAL